MRSLQECSATFDASTKLNLVLATPVVYALLVVFYASIVTLIQLCNKLRGRQTKRRRSGLTLFRKCECLLVGGLILGSPFFIRGAMMGLDCTENSHTGQYYLDIQPDLNCDWNQPDGQDYLVVFEKSLLAIFIWIGLMSLFCFFFIFTETGYKRYSFISEKVEAEWFYWELVLLLRKLCISMSGQLQSSNPITGWYLASFTILIGLLAHAYAHPFIDPWVDVAELLSLLSTVVVLMTLIAFNLAGSDGTTSAGLGEQMENVCIWLITGTTAFALLVEVRVWYLRNHDYHGAAYELQLRALSMKQLRERARAEGVGEADMEAAMDSEVPDDFLIHMMAKIRESGLAAAFEEVDDANALSDHFVLTDNPLASSDKDNDPEENEPKPKSKTLERKTKFENPMSASIA